METKELTIKIKPEERAKAKRKAWELKVYARMSVLALAAMATARLVLLTIDIIQLRAGTVGGEICIPAYAAIFIYTGWKLKSWTAGTRKGKRECTTTNATAAGADWSAVGDFEKAAKPGDLVDEEIVEEFVNCLPPTTLRGDLVQAGEPYSHQYDPEADRWRATYTTFAKVDGEWTYCGKCFVGKTKEPKGLPKA